MDSNRLLGHLAPMFAQSEENIASEALTWILRRSAVARGSVVALGRARGADLPDDLDFVGQVGTAEHGRPDIEARDATRQLRLLIEAKFAAGLTPQQPDGYLKMLPADAGAILLVVAPSARITTLWSELVGRMSTGPDTPNPSVALDETKCQLKTHDGKVLALTSWRTLVKTVAAALSSAGETGLAHDADQLLALTEQMDQRSSPLSRRVITALEQPTRSVNSDCSSTT